MILQGYQKMISLYENDTQLGIELSFKFSKAIAEKEKAFSDSKQIFKNALMSVSLSVRNYVLTRNSVHV